MYIIRRLITLIREEERYIYTSLINRLRRSPDGKEGVHGRKSTTQDNLQRIRTRIFQINTHPFTRRESSLLPTIIIEDK